MTNLALKNNIIYILTLLFSVSSVCLAQSIKFQIPPSSSIVENQSILTIAQDQEGRVWFGGKDKLFVYDSKNAINILENDSLFIKNQYLNKIVIDNNNNIILGTAYGLLIYNIQDQKYIVHKNNQFIHDQVNDIIIQDNNFYIGTNKGLYIVKYNTEDKAYKISKKITGDNVNKIVPFNRNSILYSTREKCIEVVNQNQSYEIHQIFSLPIKSDFITSIAYIKGKIWVGTKLNGIFIYENNTLTNQINESNSTLLSNYVRKIVEIDKTIYIGTLKGLSTINSNNQITNYNHNNRTNSSISQNSIYDIFVDKQNIIWIGTYFGGINTIYPNLIQIETFTNNALSTYNIDSEIISSFAEDEKNIYIGSEESGLQIINKFTKEKKNIQLSSNLVKSIYKHKDKLYVAQHNGGLSLVDLKSSKTTNIPIKDKSGYPILNINDIIIDRENNIIAATDFGIYKIENNEPKIIGVQNYKQNISITKILIDKNETLYTKINNNVYLKKIEDKQFKKLSNEYIQFITLDNEGNLWASNRSTIYKWNKTAFESKFSTQTTQLGNIFVNDNKIWIGTNDGLIIHDILNNKTNNLTKIDGLTTNNLINSTFYKSNNNDIYITSLKGINKLNSKQIKFNQEVPSTIFQSFSVLEEKYGIEKKNNLHYYATLGYNQNYFTIDFASTNLIKPQKNNYKYKLNGYDKTWKTSNIPIAKYSNIPPGTYQLEIFSSNNDQVWSEQPLIIDIDINPPIWKTWWAYLCYLIVFIFSLYFFIKFIVEWQLLINSDKEYQKKMKFFTQISHEIRTPLTLITVPIQEIVAASSDNPKIFNAATRLQKNANKLLNIVNELLEFKKLDDGKEQINLQQVDIKPYLEEYFYLFTDLAIQKNINYYIKHITPTNQVKIDIKKFDKVLFNLLSNAIKYSNENGTVFLETEIQKDNYIIHIGDNGIGLSENSQFKIFEEYYRDPKAQDIIGTGIGLSLTKEIVTLHKGNITCQTRLIDNNNWTIFTVSLPIPTNIYQKEDNNVERTISKTTGEAQETILIIEDNYEISETLISLFKDTYHILTAYDGQEGLAIAKKYLPDIIITDLMMPNMGGKELTEHLKNDTLTAHIPIIMLTADTTNESKIDGLKFGANVYLEKPFNIEILQFTVKNLLQVADKNRKDYNIEINNTTNEIDKAFIEKIENIIEKNLLNNNFGVDFLAKEIGISQPILYKKLKSITDLSVNNFIKQYRFKHALELLKTDKNISEVAYAVGFSDRKYFSKEFKKHFGQNPTEYIEKIKGTK